MTPSEVRQALHDLDLRPSRALGQNFLVDANILRIIVEAADIRPDETIIEIGSGLGVLTAELLARASRLIAIEYDLRLCAYLRLRFPQLNLIEDDAVEVLKRGIAALLEGDALSAPRPVKVVANLPYSISTPVLEQLVEGSSKPRRMVLLLQQEVARRLSATPRHHEYGALTLFTQLYYHVSIAHVVSRHCFYPAPKVDSAVTVFDRRDPRTKVESPEQFHRLVRQGFSQRRKMLRKLLGDVGNTESALAKLGISSTARAEELSLDQWISLANELGRANQFGAGLPTAPSE